MKQEKHISKAVHNEEFWQSINTDESKYPDWAVTGIFYSAMHYIDAVFARDGKHLKTHDEADTRIAMHGDLVKIYPEYCRLKKFRWNASYWSTRFSKPYIDSKIVPQFERVRSFIVDMLKK